MRLLPILGFLFFSACFSTQKTPEYYSELQRKADLAFADSFNIAPEALAELRKSTKARFAALPASKYQGFYFSETQENANLCLAHSKEKLLKLGYQLFISERAYGKQGKPDKIMALKSSSALDVLRFANTQSSQLDKNELFSLAAWLEQQPGIWILAADSSSIEWRILPTQKGLHGIVDSLYFHFAPLLPKLSQSQLAKDIEEYSSVLFDW